MGILFSLSREKLFQLQCYIFSLYILMVSRFLTGTWEENVHLCLAPAGLCVNYHWSSLWLTSDNCCFHFLPPSLFNHSFSFSSMASFSWAYLFSGLSEAAFLPSFHPAHCLGCFSHFPEVAVTSKTSSLEPPPPGLCAGTSEL